MDNISFLSDTYRFSIDGFVANRISEFLSISSKGFRFHNNKEKFYNDNKSKYDNLLGSSICLYHLELLKALEHPYTWFKKNINHTVYTEVDWLND